MVAIVMKHSHRGTHVFSLLARRNAATLHHSQGWKKPPEGKNPVCG
jgi:hypothetical protein